MQLVSLLSRSISVMIDASRLATSMSSLNTIKSPRLADAANYSKGMAGMHEVLGNRHIVEVDSTSNRESYTLSKLCFILT